MQGAGFRIAITGYGVVAPCGIGKEAFWTGLLGPGSTGVRSVELADWDPTPYFDSPKDARRSDRCEQFALAAAGEAFAQAGELGYDPATIGCILGTGIGGLRTLEEQVITRVQKGERRVSPFLVPMMMSNAAGAAISMRYGLQGPTETVCTACAASTHAIGNAARLIAWGRCNAVITGGTESAATLTALAGFSNMTALSSSLVSKPFDATRDGFIMGEGAAIFVLERMDLAQKRGATIIAEVIGAASNADAHHITAPSPGGVGAAACMTLALKDADISASDIKQINAHGTSTPLNDAAESEAIVKVFGEQSPPVLSIKGVTGHPLGAAGALEACAVLLSFSKRLIPPTAGTTILDPALNIDLVIGEPRKWQPGPTISNNFGFGGHNGSVILAPYEN
ncbi:MAG: beta-ketoacyl-[acyl-carrier-protein] synthase family protein [Ilumatobacteraceae bacterium]